MIGRRGLLAGLAATMSWRGGDPGPAGMRGGLPQPRSDQIYNPPAQVAPPGSAAGTFRGRLVVVSGSSANGSTGIFVYSPAPGPGNLVASVASLPGTDSYQNAYLAGVASYDPLSVPAIAQSMHGAITQFFTGPFGGPGPWVAQATVELFSGNLVLAGGVSGGSITVQAGVDRVDFASFIKLLERSAAPSVPVGGGYVYVDATGHLTYRGPGGTITQLAGP
jgi:hypothetical protein